MITKCHGRNVEKRNRKFITIKKMAEHCVVKARSIVLPLLQYE